MSQIREGAWTAPPELLAMSSDEHRREAVALYAAATLIQPHEHRHRSLLERAQWHATMALVERGREVTS